MIHYTEIISALDNPAIEHYRTLKRPHLHRELGIFIIEGNKVVSTFLETTMHMVSALMTPEMFDECKDRLSNRPEPIDIYIAEQGLLEKIVGFHYHQGIMAIGKVPEFPNIKDVLVKSETPRLFVALDSIESAENMGAIVRNCAACGVQGLIVDSSSADPYLRRAVRNSMGNVFSLSIIYVDNLKCTLESLQIDHYFSVYAAHPRDNCFPIYKVDYSKDCCIVFGNEGIGISKPILNVCTQNIVIPMASGVDSFNVACATGIVLYEVNRQRNLSSQNVWLK